MFCSSTIVVVVVAVVVGSNHCLIVIVVVLVVGGVRRIVGVELVAVDMFDRGRICFVKFNSFDAVEATFCGCTLLSNVNVCDGVNDR